MKPSCKILVTGAAGHLGSHLAPALLEDGFEVAGVDVRPPADSFPARCAFHQADLANAASIDAVLDGVSLIVHTASIHPWKPYSDDQYIDCNVKGTWHLYRKAEQHGIRRIVLTSSIAAPGMSAIPHSAWPVGEDAEFVIGDIYSATKKMQETIARSFAARDAIRTFALRPPAFMPRPPLQTCFSLTGAFAVVSDMVSAHVAAARVMSGRQPSPESLAAFEAFNTTVDLPYRSEDAALMNAKGNLPLVRKYWPAEAEWLVQNGFEGASVVAVYDNRKARRALGWQAAYNLPQAVRDQRSNPDCA